MISPTRKFFLGAEVLTAVILFLGLRPVAGQMVFGEQSYNYEPSDVLSGATQFDRKENFWEASHKGEDGASVLVGYVYLTDDLVDIPGYSGQTMNTLVGMDTAGKITGVKIVRHSEPIVLIGLSENVMHDFIGQYLCRDIRDRVIISDTPRDGYVKIDAISGATVTAVAENATILKAGRQVGRSVGLLQDSDIRNKRPTRRYESLTWEALVARGLVGEVAVHPGDLGLAGSVPLLDVKFSILDPPSAGLNLLGDRFYAIVKERLKNGGSALFIGANGKISFKGAGFARGGIFDRFSIEQDGSLFDFKDIDYINLTNLAIEDAPKFHEGGIFFLTDESFDPAEPFTFHLVIPYRVRDKRSYSTFLKDFELPADFVEEEIPFWVGRWQDNLVPASGFGLLLVCVATMFLFRQRLLPHRKLLHRTVALVSVVWVGLLMKAQPSATQILTLANSAVHFRFPAEIYLSEPLIFLFWIAIVLSIPLWGRGYFCGWLCPYGALLEVLIAVRVKVVPLRLTQRLDAWDPGPGWKAGKYVTFAVMLGIGFYNLPLAEMLGEVEPFKTFILRLVRPSYFVAYFVVVTLLSILIHRGFCRFLCPLGGALALPTGRLLKPLARHKQCTSCKICFRGCGPKAISYETGEIDYRECLQCWDCQMIGKDESVCPELITAKREDTAPRLIAGLSVVVLLAMPLEARSRTLVVDPVESISGAIQRCEDGDSVLVRAGVYRERVVLDKRLTIIGKSGAVVDAGGKGHVMAITASGAVVEGLTLRGSGEDFETSDSGIWVAKAASDVRLERNRIEQCWFGIWIHGSNGVRLIGNTIEGRGGLSRNARGDGIHMWDVRNAEVRGNIISHSRDGIYMELSKDCRIIGNTIEQSRYAVHTMWCDGSVFNENEVKENLVGLALMFSKRIEAQGNVLHNNITHGLLLIQVTRAEVSDNLMIGNTKGLFVYNSLYNEIRRNFIARNNMGLHYWAGSEENILADNAFVENGIQTKFVASHDQEWDGNFWSDYVGWDADGDGLGDTPYRSNTMVDALLWRYPAAKLLLASPAFQSLAFAEREFPVITVPKAVDKRPLMSPVDPNWTALMERYRPRPKNYYGSLVKLPHIPGER